MEEQNTIRNKNPLQGCLLLFISPFYYMVFINLVLIPPHLIGSHYPALYFPVTYVSLLMGFWIAYLLVRLGGVALSLKSLKGRTAGDIARRTLRGLVPISAEFPANAPQLANALVTAPIFIYLTGGIMAESLIGRPSSTSGIAYLFLMVPVLLVLIVSTMLGNSFITEKAYDTPRRLSRMTMALIYAGILLLTFIPLRIKWQGVVDYEAERRPALIHTSGLLNPVSTVTELSKESPLESTMIFGYRERNKGYRSVRIAEGEFRISGPGNVLTIKRTDAPAVATARLTKYSYITGADALVIELEPEHHGGILLALAIRFRATSDRSMLLVYDGNLNLVYQELLERRGITNSMRLIKDKQGRRYLAHDISGATRYYLINAPTAPAI